VLGIRYINGVEIMILKKVNSIIFLSIFLVGACQKKVGDKSKGESKKRAGFMVMVAASPLKSGTKLSSEIIKEKFVPKEFYSTKMVKMVDLKKNLGKPLSRDMKKGEMLFFFDFEQSKSQLISKIRPGGRAFLLRLPGRAYKELITSGTHLDIISVAMGDVSGIKEMGSTTILENLVTSRSYLECDKKGKCSTVLVLLLMPEESEQLSLALKIGTVEVAVRNPQDHGLIKVKRVTTISSFRGVKDKSPLDKNLAILKQIKKLKVAPKPDKEVKGTKIEIKLRP
jgi:Flp pilus assembly protein CpaB